jgi:chromosomal replication initiator protein
MGENVYKPTLQTLPVRLAKGYSIHHHPPRKSPFRLLPYLLTVSLSLRGLIVSERERELLKIRSACEIWETALGELQLQVSKSNYRTWLAKTTGWSYQDNIFIVGVPNTFVAEYLDKNLRALIEKSLIGITQCEVKVKFSVNSQMAALSPAPEPVATLPAVVSSPVVMTSPRLNSKYTFDSFVVSKCNRLAHAAAIGAAENPGLSSYNPLYIYGGVGLGKTHLLNAIGHSALSRNMRVIYLSAEQFTTDFVNSLRERKTDEFRRKYRSADMLLIDDIQFIIGKEQTEECFFHIFNELHSTDHQIAITSNCPPHGIPHMGDRLRSRLEWGLTAGIQSPDYETRLAILRAKAEREKVEITPDVLEYIADKIKQNIRELEGSLNRVVAYAKLLRTMVTPELASEALEDIATKQPRTPATPAMLMEAVAGSFQVDILDLKSHKRDRQTLLARQIAMYLLREDLELSLSQIGRHLGGREPITVSQAHHKISDSLEANSELRQKVIDIRQTVSSQQKNL